MKLIFCVDNDGGVAFNKRRQSRDRILIDDIASHISSLYIGEYSKALFSGKDVTVSEDFSDTNGSYFLEREIPEELIVSATEIVLYRWNRSYPHDTIVDTAFEKYGYTLTDESEFVGSSHEKITKELWKKI